MYNRIILIGRLTRDPELRYVPSGAPVASFTLAVDRPFRDQQGNRETDFIDIVAWRKLAEQVSQYMSKGRMVAVEGRLQIRSYETQDGQKRKVAEVVADGVRFLDRARPGGGSPGAGPPESAPADDRAEGSPDEDVPF
jgi:single-strand DNA-binding protein